MKKVEKKIMNDEHSLGGDSQLLSISIVYIKLSGLYKNMIIKKK